MTCNYSCHYSIWSTNTDPTGDVRTLTYTVNATATASARPRSRGRPRGDYRCADRASRPSDAPPWPCSTSSTSSQHQQHKSLISDQPVRPSECRPVSSPNVTGNVS